VHCPNNIVVHCSTLKLVLHFHLLFAVENSDNSKYVVQVYCREHTQQYEAQLARRYVRYVRQKLHLNIQLPIYFHSKLV
jgi:hypothetical protein